METSLDHSISDQVRTFVTKLQELVRRSAVDAVQGAFGDVNAPLLTTTRGARLRKGIGSFVKPVGKGIGGIAKTAAPILGRAARKRGKRSTEQVDAMALRVHTFVRANAGTRLEQIAKGLSAATKDLTLPVAKLLAARRLRKTGQKRGTRYFVATGAATKARVARKPRRRPRARKA